MKPRSTRVPLALAIGLLLIGGCGRPSTPAGDPLLSSLSIDPAIFGADWEATDSLVLDSWRGIGQLHPAQRKMAEAIRETLEPRGLVALCSFGFGRTRAPLDSADLRIYRFETAEQREAWMAVKYGYEGWEEHYTRVEAPDMVLDNTQLSKRIVGVGPYWITSGALRPGGNHLVLLEQALEQLGL